MWTWTSTLFSVVDSICGVETNTWVGEMAYSADGCSAEDERNSVDVLGLQLEVDGVAVAGVAIAGGEAAGPDESDILLANLWACCVRRL